MFRKRTPVDNGKHRRGAKTGPAGTEVLLEMSEGSTLKKINTDEINAFQLRWEAGRIDDGTYCVALKGVDQDGDALIIAKTPAKIFADYLVMIQDIAVTVGELNAIAIPQDREIIACMHHYQYCFERDTCKGVPDLDQSDYDYADTLLEMWELYRDKVKEPVEVETVEEPGDVAVQPMGHGEASLQSPWPRAERDSNM